MNLNHRKEEEKTTQPVIRIAVIFDQQKRNQIAVQNRHQHDHRKEVYVSDGTKQWSCPNSFKTTKEHSAGGLPRHNEAVCHNRSFNIHYTFNLFTRLLSTRSSCKVSTKNAVETVGTTWTKFVQQQTVRMAQSFRQPKWIVNPSLIHARTTRANTASFGR